MPKIMGPFWLWVILRHLIFRGTKMKTLILGTAHVGVRRFGKAASKVRTLHSHRILMSNIGRFGFRV